MASKKNTSFISFGEPMLKSSRYYGGERSQLPSSIGGGGKTILRATSCKRTLPFILPFLQYSNYIIVDYTSNYSPISLSTF